MYCSKCGGKVQEGGRFCANCGSDLGQGNSRPREKSDPGEPLLVLKPRFVPWVTVLSALPLQIFFTIWGGGFFGGFSMLAVKGLRLNLPGWFTFVFFGAAFFIGIPFLFYFAKKKTYAKTEYRFFRDRLEYSEGFWTVENKTIRYDKITEVSMRRGVIQRKYGLGCIFLATPASGFSQGKTASGIVVQDVENPEQVYTLVQDVLHK